MIAFPYVGQRVRINCFRRCGGTGEYGVIVAFRSQKWDKHTRPVCVFIDGCPKRVFKFRFDELTYLDDAERAP